MMSSPIFLSYASQDADTARRICDALRTAGLEVWFDQSELRGGDAWDASIKKQIKECALFIPVISATTEARLEGYFRLEWRLADQRTHLMAKAKPFLLPVVIDVTKDVGAHVPDSFLDVQWTRLADADTATLESFAASVAKRLAEGVSSSTNFPSAASMSALGALQRAASQASPAGPTSVAAAAQVQPPSRGTPNLGPGLQQDGGATGVPKAATPPDAVSRTKIAVGLAIAAMIVTGVYIVIQNNSPSQPPSSTADPGKSRAINSLSVMVMPFANQTGDKEKDYIADALTSSITSDLTRIRDAFIVPATTAFSLRGKQLTVPQLGKEAAVRFVLTGSVTSDKERLRINSVLSDTQTGAQLWTENFDGKQTDMFALQDQVTTRIGNTIGPQMVILAARESEKRSNTPQVADLLMRARALELDQISLKNLQAREALYRQSLALEPSDLAAQVGLALSLAMQSWGFASDLKLDRSGRVALAKQAGEMLQSVKRIEPNNPKIHFALSTVASVTGDVTGAVLAARRLVELEPKEYWSHIRLGLALQAAGDTPSARAALQHAMQLASPARPPGEALFLLSVVAFIEDRPDEVLQLAQKAIQVNPNNAINHLYLALGYARKGDQVQARRAAADAVRINPNLKLSIKNETPWPGKEAAYLKYVETQYLPAWRLAGLPE